MCDNSILIKNLKKFILFLLLLSSNSGGAVDKDWMANKVSREAVKILTNKYPLKLSGFGGGAIYGINVLSLSFNVEKNVSIAEARKLILDCAEVFLNEINSDQEIRPYLSEYPYPVSRIKLTFFVRPPPPFLEEGKLSCFSIRFSPRQKQTYLDYDETKEGRLKEVLCETYEEAVKRAKSE